MSFEDLRDNYKTLRQSNDVKLKLNGATYRKLRGGIKYKQAGNLLTKLEMNTNRKQNDDVDDLNALNVKYDLSTSNLPYSLNKKKRWEFVKDLKQNMNEFGEEDLDVRLYETRNRNEKKANCVAIHKSKGQQIHVKNTYANLDSIKKRLDLDQDAIRREKFEKKLLPSLQAEPVAIGKKIKKKSSASKKPGRAQDEHIVINVDSDDDSDENGYYQYEIEYAPNKDVLKYDPRKLNMNEKVGKSTNKNKAFYERYLSISDDETWRKNYDVDEYESSDDGRLKENDEIMNDQTKIGSEILLDLNDLIEKLANTTFNIESKSKALNESTANLEKLSTLQSNTKDNKVYVEKEDYVIVNHISKDKTVKRPAFEKIAKPIPINLFMDIESISQDNLKRLYGLNYSEAFNCWPRMFNVNITDSVMLKLKETTHLNGQNLNIIAWLVFLEDVSNPSNNQIVKEYKVKLCTNLIQESISLENINPCQQVYQIQQVHMKAVDLLASLPVEHFRLNETSTKPWIVNTDNSHPTTKHLNNLTNTKKNKSINDLKLMLISEHGHQNQNDNITTTTTPSFIRSNSIIVVVKKLEDKEAEAINLIRTKCEKILSEKSYECILCLETRTNLNDCTLNKKCSHCICNDCMTDYVNLLLENVILHAGKLQCPGCTNDLEFACMISFANNGNQLENFMRLSVERVIFVLNNYKWCPQPNCSKILKVDLNSNQFGIVSCECGYKMCLKCNKEPHFPAKCEQIANYYEELKNNNDLEEVNDSFYSSKGKRCPVCFSFMEKNGGCNHMTCTVCREHFCWLCLTPTGKDQFEHYECKPEKAGSVIIEFKKERKSTSHSKTKYRYENSVLHRQKRMKPYEKVLESNLEKLCDMFEIDEKELYVNKEGKTQLEYLIEIGKLKSEKRSELRKFLNEVVSFLSELHFVCEHSYVFLRDSKTNQDKKYKDSLSHILKMIELVIWRIEMKLKNDSNENVNTLVIEIKQLFKQGLNSLQMLKSLKSSV